MVIGASVVSLPAEVPCENHGLLPLTVWAHSPLQIYNASIDVAYQKEYRQKNIDLEKGK